MQVKDVPVGDQFLYHGFKYTKTAAHGSLCTSEAGSSHFNDDTEVTHTYATVADMKPGQKFQLCTDGCEYTAVCLDNYKILGFASKKPDVYYCFCALTGTIHFNGGDRRCYPVEVK